MNIPGGYSSSSTSTDAFEVIPGLNMNGHLTLGENIADFGGITLAYYAYIAARDRSESGEKEDVQDIRRFFLGFASIWRESVRDRGPPERRVIRCPCPGRSG